MFEKLQFTSILSCDINFFNSFTFHSQRGVETSKASDCIDWLETCCSQSRVMHFFMRSSFQAISLHHNSETEWRLGPFFLFFYAWLATQLVTLIFGAHLDTVLIV